MTAAPVLRVDLSDPTPPFEQLRRQLAELIGSGVMRPHDRLPPLRQLAADLGLAVGTVARTCRELEHAGLVVSRRGAGTRVGAAAGRSPGQVDQALTSAAGALVQQLGCSGSGTTQSAPPWRALREQRA